MLEYGQVVDIRHLLRQFPNRVFAMSVQVDEVRGLGPIIVIVLLQEPLHVLYLRLRQLLNIALLFVAFEEAKCRVNAIVLV